MHYLFHPDRKERRLFISALRIGWRKDPICIPMVLNCFVFFKANKEYVKNQFIDNPKVVLAAKDTKETRKIA